MIGLDVERYPRLSAFVADLPQGLASYPERQSKGSVLREALEQHPVGPDAELPPELARLVLDPPAASAWMTAAAANAGYLAIADYHQLTSAAYSQAAYEVNRTLFRSPLYRALMVVTSPERLMRSASTRWRQFHRGTDLEVSLGERSATVRIQFPHRLFPKLVGEGMVGSMRAALEASHGRAVNTRLEVWNDLVGVASANWG